MLETNVPEAIAELIAGGKYRMMQKELEQQERIERARRNAEWKVNRFRELAQAALPEALRPYVVVGLQNYQNAAAYAREDLELAIPGLAPMRVRMRLDDGRWRLFDTRDGSNPYGVAAVVRNTEFTYLAETETRIPPDVEKVFATDDLVLACAVARDRWLMLNGQHAKEVHYEPVAE